METLFVVIDTEDELLVVAGHAATLWLVAASCIYLSKMKALKRKFGRYVGTARSKVNA